MSTTTFEMNEQDQLRFNELMAETYKKGLQTWAYRLRRQTRWDAEESHSGGVLSRLPQLWEITKETGLLKNWIFRIVTRLFLEPLAAAVDGA